MTTEDNFKWFVEGMLLVSRISQFDKTYMKYLDNILTGGCGNSWDFWRSRCHFCVQLQEVPEAVLHPPDNPGHLRRDLHLHVHHALRSTDPVSLCNGKRY